MMIISGRSVMGTVWLLNCDIRKCHGDSMVGEW